MNGKGPRKVYYMLYDSGYWLKPRPMIRLIGRYLERYGFGVGAPIEVDLEQGKITITTINETTKETSESLVT